MAKLKKSLKQEQRRSKHQVAKLTPAEIRSLNHSASVSKSGSIRSIDGQSIHRVASNTPPLTPDHLSSSQQAHAQRRRSSADLPTPPVSPDWERRGSNSSTRHIHAPRPISHTQAMQLANASSHARPPSATSYRGVATYRGPEITRTGSLTMLHTPSQQIVSNPLSQFSRPRQSTLTSSPQKTSPEQRFAEEDTVSPAVSKQRHQSLNATSKGPSRDHSPIRPSDSPVSMEDGKVPELVNAESATSGEVPVVHVTPEAKTDGKQDDASEKSKKQKLNWRKSFTGSERDPELAPLRKEHRRRSMISPKQGYCLHAVAYTDTKPRDPPQLRDTLKDELPSAKTAEYAKSDQKPGTVETEYEQHPAVRPLSIDGSRSIKSASDTSSSKKGKEREDVPGVENDSDSTSLSSSVPSYQRCSCCGRIAKPGGFETELSPVPENENAKTNTSFEAKRMSADARRRSGSVDQAPKKFVPIYPSDKQNQTKQARNERSKESIPSVVGSEPPARPIGVGVTKLGDVIGPSSTPLAIMPKSKEKPRFVRFASLHMKKEDMEEDVKQQQDSTRNFVEPHQLQRFGSLYGRNNAQQGQQQGQQEGQNKPALQQQSAYPPQQRSSYAHQTQRQRQSFSQSNGQHPLRSSISAYENDTLSTPIPNNYGQSPSNASVDAVEKPLGDSPSSSENRLPESPGDTISDNDGMAVDLSSFDGSFVQRSLSRSATVMRNASSAQTSNGLSSSNSTRSINEPNIGRAIAPPPGSTTASAPWPTSPNGKPNFSRPLTPQQPAKIDTSMSAKSYYNSSISSSPFTGATDPRSFSSPYGSTPTPIDTNIASASSTMAHKPGTIVKHLPSAHMSATSSPTSANSTGPLRLGDWVLPQSQRTTSASDGSKYSARDSMNSEQRGIAT